MIIKISRIVSSMLWLLKLVQITVPFVAGAGEDMALQIRDFVSVPNRLGNRLTLYMNHKNCSICMDPLFFFDRNTSSESFKMSLFCDYVKDIRLFADKHLLLLCTHTGMHYTHNWLFHEFVRLNANSQPDFGILSDAFYEKVYRSFPDHFLELPLYLQRCLLKNLSLRFGKLMTLFTSLRLHPDGNKLECLKSLIHNDARFENEMKLLVEYTAYDTTLDLLLKKIVDMPSPDNCSELLRLLANAKAPELLDIVEFFMREDMRSVSNTYLSIIEGCVRVQSKEKTKNAKAVEIILFLHKVVNYQYDNKISYKDVSETFRPSGVIPVTEIDCIVLRCLLSECLSRRKMIDLIFLISKYSLRLQTCVAKRMLDAIIYQRSIRGLIGANEGLILDCVFDFCRAQRLTVNELDDFIKVSHEYDFISSRDSYKNFRSAQMGIVGLLGLCSSG